MNYIDIIIILVVTVGAIYGAVKGVIRQLGSLGGFILGIILSRIFGGELSAVFQNAFEMPAQVGDVVAHILIFVVVYIVSILVVRLIHQLAHRVAMGWIDRLAGMLFGAIKWGFVLSLLLNLMTLIDPSGKLLSQKDFQASKCYEYTLRFAPATFSIAQEKLLDETKVQSDLFIPCGENKGTRLHCQNCKADKDETR